MNKEPLLTSNFVSVWLTNFFLQAGRALLVPILPLYLKGLGANDGLIGLIMGGSFLFGVFVRPPIGRALDLRSKKKILFVGLSLAFCSSIGYMFLNSLWSIFIVRLLYTTGLTISGLTLITLVSEVIPQSRRGEGYGFFGTTHNFALAMAASAAPFLLNKYSFFVVFLSCSSLSLFPLIFQLKIKEVRVKEEIDSKKESGFIEKKALLPSFALFFGVFNRNSFNVFYPLFAASLGLNPGTFFSVMALALILSRFTIARVSDRYGRVVVIIPAYLVIILSTITIAFSSSHLPILIASAVYGLANGALISTLDALLIDRVEIHRRGTALAMFENSRGIAAVVSPVVLGVIAQAFGYDKAFLTSFQ